MTLQSFRRLYFRRFGQADVFEWELKPLRALQPQEVLIEVHFIGINYADIIARRGYYRWAGTPPICPGFEVAGKIIAKGEAVAWEVGTPVMAVTKFGGYTEALIVEQKRVWPLPAHMTLQEASAFPAVYLTAYHSLMEVMRIRPGDDLLIQAVAGGVGVAALQIAKHQGVTVYGTASSQEKLEFARHLGMDYGINYVSHDFEQEVQRLTQKKGVKFVLDSLGGRGLRQGMNCLKPSGLAVTIGAAGVVPPTGFSWQSAQEWARISQDLIQGGVYHPFGLIEKNRGLAGVQILLLWDELEYLRGLMENLLRLYEAGVTRPQIDRVFRLEEAGEAHTYIESRRSKGKVLLSTIHAEAPSATA